MRRRAPLSLQTGGMPWSWVLGASGGAARRAVCSACSVCGVELFAVFAVYAVPSRSLCGCVPSVSGVNLSLRLLSCAHLQEPHIAYPCALAPLTLLCLPLALSRHCSCADAPQPALTRLCLRSRLCPSPSLCSISLRYSEWYPIWSAATLGKLFEPAAWQRRAYAPNGKLCFRAEILAVD